MATKLNRRDFLGTTSAAAATLAFGAHVGEARAAESKPLRVVVMGVNGRGRQLMNTFTEFPQVEIAYVCDPDENVIPETLKLITGKNRPEPKAIRDVRVALDDPNVDVLVCAAPDHWHALATIWACQAGKNVYVEKPISHNIVEGRRMIEAARKYDRVVQGGTQRRSAQDYIDAVKKIQSGAIGKVPFVRAWINSVRPSIGYEQPTQPPQNLDFNLWAGPGFVDAYKTNLVHYHWHWRWDYGTGECGNSGIHALDVARWGLGVEAPKRISSGGDKYFFDDDQETPDTHLATFDFDNGAIQWEHRTWSKRGINGSTFGVEFYGTDATLFAGSSGWTIYDGEKVREKREGADREKSHAANFLACVVSRQKPNADIEIAHRSTTLCHLANIAWRTRSTVRFDGETETIADNPQASALLSRTYRKGFELPEVV